MNYFLQIANYRLVIDQMHHNRHPRLHCKAVASFCELRQTSLNKHSPWESKQTPDMQPCVRIAVDVACDVHLRTFLPTRVVSALRTSMTKAQVKIT